jgi:hypothetical protein
MDREWRTWCKHVEKQIEWIRLDVQKLAHPREKRMGFAELSGKAIGLGASIAGILALVLQIVAGG